MNWRFAALAVSTVCFVGGVVACVGDSPSTTTTPDAQAPDATTSDGSSTQDASSDGSPAVDATVEAGLCSDPVVGNTVGLPNGTATSSTLSPSGPLLAGDYKLTGVGAFFGPCFPAPCTPKPKSGSILGGLRVVSKGGSNYTIERRIEMQQTGVPKVVRLDRFDASFDALNRKLSVTRTCLGDDAGATDAGAAWTTNVDLVDASPNGVVEIDMTDIEAVQTEPDGGAAANARLRMFFTKQ